MRYPALEIPDLYKLVHQAAMGSEHAVRDTLAARRWLDRELAQLGPGPTVPTIEALTPGGDLVRVNIRPFLRDGGSPEALLAALIRTANEYRGSTATLATYWSLLEAMADSGEIRFPREELAAYFDRKRREGFPAAHHSHAYIELYRPAYRVVRYEFLLGKPTFY